MKNWIARGIVTIVILCLVCSVPGLTGCGGRKKREDPKSRPDFVDTSDPSKVQMKPIGGPEGGTGEAGAAKQ